MNVLVCNDDGILSEGIIALANFLKKENKVFVIAPDGNRSGFSHAMTFRRNITLKKTNAIDGCECYVTSGTPSDCVKLGVNFLKDIDLVCSGINEGANLGTDILYSGTVNAGIEANIHKIKAIAFSNVAQSGWNFKHNIEFIEKNFDKLLKMTSVDYVLNVNMPNLPLSEIKGVKIADTGFNEYDDGYVPSLSPDTYKLVGEPLPMRDNDLEKDVHFASLNYVTITPVVHKITDEVLINKLKKGEFI